MHFLRIIGREKVAEDTCSVTNDNLNVRPPADPGIRKNSRAFLKKTADAVEVNAWFGFQLGNCPIDRRAIKVPQQVVV